MARASRPERLEGVREAERGVTARADERCIERVRHRAIEHLATDFAPRLAWRVAHAVAERP